MAPFGPVSLPGVAFPGGASPFPADPDPDPAPTDGPPSPGLPGAGGAAGPPQSCFRSHFRFRLRLRVRQRAVRGAPTQVAGRRRPRRRRGRWPRPPDRSLRLPARANRIHPLAVEALRRPDRFGEVTGDSCAAVRLALDGLGSGSRFRHAGGEFALSELPGVAALAKLALSALDLAEPLFDPIEGARRRGPLAPRRSRSD